MEIIKCPLANEYKVVKELYVNNSTKRSFYQVKNSLTGLYYGLKVLEATSPTEQKQVKNEVVALNRLPFGLTAKCHQHWFDGKQNFLILDWIEGTPLADAFSGKPDSSAEFKKRIRVAEKIASELNKIHRHRVLHRDIKPENIVLQMNNGNVYGVKLIDFGMSNQKRGLEEGTYNYSSPEQNLVRHENITASSDVFSLCQVIHYLLFGEPKVLEPNFTNDGWEEGVNVNLPDFYPKRVKQILESGLVFNPRKRTQQAFSVVKELKQIK